MPNRLGLRNAVEGDAGRGRDSLGGDAAPADGDVYGDCGRARQGGEVPRICEGDEARQEAPTPGMAGASEHPLNAANMRYLHLAGQIKRDSVGLPPLLSREEKRKNMDEGYELLLEVAGRYLKSEGPPAQPPAWLQPPVQQSGGRDRSAPRRRRARTFAGREVLRGDLGILGVLGTGSRGAAV